MEDKPQNIPAEATEAASLPEEQSGPEDKALKKTYQEFREEARHSVLSSADREKYETLEPDEKQFVDTACLFEFKSQAVTQQKHKVKMRDILLCRDVAQAYCSGRDLVGQYSEGQRILKNSESGGDTVKFVLGRRICTMMEKIQTLYSQHPRSYVSADLHKAETGLLNYVGRMGKMMRDPLSEARRIYVRLKERTGWEIPAAAFAMAEDCDVPQLFFNRYTDSSQLLLKDPQKPFRSDNMTPPLKLDFRIKNAVLVLAGENRFHIDKKKFETVQNTAAARAIMLNSLDELKRKIKANYERNIFKLAEGLSPGDDINVRAMKEAAFNSFYGYTLKSLPNTAARADATELFILKWMEEENSVELKGFCRAIYPPEAVKDDSNPELWSPGVTRAFKVRHVFQDVGTGKARLSMFATRMNQLVTEYLEKQLSALKEKQSTPFLARIKQAENRLISFLSVNRVLFEQAEAKLKRVQGLEEERKQYYDQAISLINQSFNRSLKAGTDQEKEELIGKIRPKLEEEAAKREEMLEKLKERHQGETTKHQTLCAHVKSIDELVEKYKQQPGDPALKDTESQLFAVLSGMANGGQKPENLVSLRELAAKNIIAIRDDLNRIKEQYAAVGKIQKSLKEILSLIQAANARSEEIENIKKENEALESLFKERQALIAAVDEVKAERDDALSKIEEELEVNRET
jgi:hypothetical protein